MKVPPRSQLPSGDPDVQSASPETRSREDTGDPPETRPKLGSETPAHTLGKSVGAYVILEEVAVGGMGVIFKAKREADETVVALKTMRLDKPADPQEAERFHAEILAVARLHHPHVMPILDIGWHEGRPYYTMPLCSGGSLAGLRQTKGSDVRRVVALLEKVARGVHYAHQQGVLHRDLKPANILLDDHDGPLVSDFGLAKIRDANMEFTQPGTRLGTWPYMSPEQAMGRNRDLNYATDVWALGVILYELLAGQRPFPQKDLDRLQEAILAAEPTALRAQRPDVSPELEAIVERCLQKDPARRYESAEALADALSAWLHGTRPTQSAKRVLLTVVGLLVLGVVGTGILLQAFPPGETVAPPPAKVVDVAQKPTKPAGADARPLVMPTPTKPENKNQKEPDDLVLIGKAGPPTQMQWIAGADQAALTEANLAKVFALRSTGTSLLELLPSAPWPHYRLEAKVVHRADDKAGRVGIFVGHLRIKQEGMPQNVFWAFYYSETGKAAGARELIVGRIGNGLNTGSAFSRNRTFAPDERPGRERHLALEVDEDGVRAFWDGELVANTIASHAKSLVQGNYTTAQGERRDALQAGSLGLFVRYGEAAFRDVIVRRLPAASTK